MEVDTKRNYVYIEKNSSGDGIKSVDTGLSKKQYGDIIYKNLPLSSSISIEYYEDDSELDDKARNEKRIRLHALKNTLNRNGWRSGHYNFSSSFGNKLVQELVIVSIPSIFYGRSIQKGSVDLTINYNGQKIAQAKDIKNNGELIETVGLKSGSVAGVILYDEGFILLTGSWDQNISASLIPEIGTRWNCFGTGSEYLVNSGSFDINFNGVNEIHSLTMLAHADKGELNHSNNPTYLKYAQENRSASVMTDGYYEYDKVEIKNITKYEYDNYSGSLEKQTYISKIGIYDDKNNLLGIAKLAKPIRKSVSRDFTFKLKLDI